MLACTHLQIQVTKCWSFIFVSLIFNNKRFSNKRFIMSARYLSLNFPDGQYDSSNFQSDRFTNRSSKSGAIFKMSRLSCISPYTPNRHVLPACRSVSIHASKSFSKA